MGLPTSFFYTKNNTHLQEIILKSIRWSQPVCLSSLYFTGLSPQGFLLFEVEGDETQIRRPIEDLITEMKEWETIKDKRIKQMKRWKEVIAKSPAESRIRSDHIFRNAQRYAKTWCMSFPSNFSLCFWRHLFSASLHSWWPTHFHELHTGQVTIWEKHLRPPEYSVT